MDYLSPSVDMALGMTERLQDIPFRDARWLFAFPAALTWVGLRLVRTRPPLPAGQRWLLVYSLVSYALWGIAFYYVLVDSSLSSFLIPYFPGQTRFAGLEGAGSTRFEELLAARIAAHRGKLFWLVSRGRPAPSTSPERFGLAVSDDCGVIRTGEGKWALCRVARPSGPRIPA